MSWSEGYITHRGVKLHYTRTGGQKPALIFLHGITDNGLCWSRVAQTLESKFDCILLDGRGHGLSDGPESGYGVAQLAQDVLAVMDELAIAHAIFIGHSMGGSIASYLGSHYPQRVRALILEDPALYVYPPELGAALLDKWQKGLLERRTQTREFILDDSQAETGLWHPLEVEHWIQSKQQANPACCTFILEPRPTWESMLGTLTCPTLLLYPDALNVAVDVDLAEEIRQTMPHIQLIQVQKAGHSIRRDQFETYMRHVQDFLAAL